MKSVICLMGPTACGKTQVAIDAVERGPFEIVSVDSAMIYRGMDIGTAKPTAEELARAPHRLIDICDPANGYSVGQFLRDVEREIRQIHAKQKTPLLVGGSMLYFHQLQHGMHLLPQTTPEIRTRVATLAAQHGWPGLHTKLAHIDPATAERLEPTDAQRISRAYEIYLQTGQPLSVWHMTEAPAQFDFNFHSLILAPKDRKVIHQRIEKRFDQMLDSGFIDEVKMLFNRDDLSPALPSIRCVGYRQAWSYLAGEFTKLKMREKAIVATRQLCKRQLTWLRRWEDAQWVEQPAEALTQILRWKEAANE